MTRSINYDQEVLKISYAINQYKDEPDLEGLNDYIDDMLSLAVFHKHNPLIDFISKHIIDEVGESTKEVLDHPLVFKNNENARGMIYTIINSNLEKNNLNKLKRKALFFLSTTFQFFFK